MSRSTRKTPVFGNCAGSDKMSKRKANRAYRRAEKLVIASGDENDGFVMPVMNEIHNSCTFQKDGKHYWTEASDRDMMK